MSRDARHPLRWLPLLRSGKPPRPPVARSPAPQVIAVEADGETYDITVRRHRLARRYTLRIHATRREAMLSMPMRGSLADAKEFAQRHGAWLAERLRKLPDGVAFRDGASVPLRGEQVRIVHRPRARGTVWLECGDDGTNLLCVAGDAAHTARRVKDHLKREARRDLAISVRHYAETLGVTFRRISIRDPSSRWGSCNSDGVLSFSWRLILAPPYVLDYLAAHEVAHLVEMNHSVRFWRVVARICPEMDRAKAWLNAHGNDLHRYGLDG
ncbi:SprT family zinc-dependent metalloprotease [Bradyrhizobium sp. LHD-71]|uniref:M48 family metallopeptidase n=1 Tax=Bradyrhizobium sp. LHD-71 TaxID=3072141 RepID=UPI00280D99DD|nr:SprT family zinc-dependent metalloprotease [Bradyrhizobium sp. LHD-71]MDQ8732672.1 SprT family zinc-dependent metalloprotease [Bradyrhizobium sp. LHD-71]